MLIVPGLLKRDHTSAANSLSARPFSAQSCGVMPVMRQLCGLGSVSKLGLS
jgi:hypothetical protein